MIGSGSVTPKHSLHPSIFNPMQCSTTMEVVVLLSTTRSAFSSTSETIPNSPCSNHQYSVHDARSQPRSTRFPDTPRYLRPSESPGTSDRFSSRIHGQAELAANEAQPKLWYKSTSATYSDYCPHIYSLVSGNLGAKSILLSSFVVRDAVAYDSVRVTFYIKGIQEPAPRPHINHASTGGRALLRNMLPNFFAQRDRVTGRPDSEIDAFVASRTAVLEAEDRCAKAAGVEVKDWDGMNYDRQRWAITSVRWPLEPVRRVPLAIMDFSAVLPEEDFVPVAGWFDSFKGWI